MHKYDPKSKETLRISNLTYGLLKWFYNEGDFKSCERDEALFIDQRVFGPATAKGLLACDGTVWYLTEAGRIFVDNFENRNAWKDHASRNFSHYIKIRRAQLEIVRKRSGRQDSGRMAATA